MRALLACLLPAAALAFAPSVPRLATTQLRAATHLDTGDDVDIQHARYCADHFGECSLEEMERMRDALHKERVAHVFADEDGLRNPHGVPEDFEHKLLENDLTLQMGLLQDKLATEHMEEDSRAAYGMNPYSSTMNLPILDGGLDEESSETLMICLAIAGLALLPQLFGSLQ